MEIVYYPDPVLQRRAAPVDLAMEGLAEFVEEMKAAMKSANGVGLAAPQVGRSLRLFIASESGEVADAVAFINPELRTFGERVPFEEGCLSLPGVNGDVERPESVAVSWTDVHGKRHEEEFSKLMARIVQHEFDHLEGILFITRLTPADRIRVKPALDSFEEHYRSG